ncbi:MAG: peptide chain release factor N(5)-glutamine methyltransferase [Thermoleophilia bacterium]|nr:peptide chain release factor N(5)-glutamine methyltransferase [Thermoleophilia bacterium]
MGAPPTITDLLAKSAAWLKEKGSTSPRLDAELLLAEVLGMNRVELYVNFEQPLNLAELDIYREFIRRRGEGEPVAYILGRGFFRNHELRLNNTVLIPRPETEHVVDAALDFLMEGEWSAVPAVLDLGTGSGAIAISLTAGFPEAVITASDASIGALELAQQNAATAGVAPRISFVRSDMFDDLDPMDTFDLIVSNPPYISRDEWAALPRDVREYEPREALYGGEDGLDYYRVLAEQAPQFLKPRGGLIMEIGSTQGKAVTELLQATGKFRAAGVLQDYAGLERVVAAQRI